ncbi:putative mfs transporter [Aspergillus terreus]|uniref:Putative mfs transporter n=1 Tax=Aspergillus terreus TaxID=33178 RepID=A0A5M3YPX2_ASPTE|nr:hypothetical protein ATETN484_0002065300 [Aspergillus terreus]GFF15509.1 putative mfs transporter [Aspergillus terreus]
MHGISNLFWMPLAVKYGRRPVYLASFGLFFIAAVWAGMAKSFASELAARILMGLGSGSAECVAPLTISDIFFLHERGRVMSFYTIALSAGGGAGSVVAGLISLRRDWRVMYYITSGFIGLLIILIGVSMPETVFQRVPEGRPSDHLEQLKVKTTPSANHIEDLQRPPTKKRWKQNLSLWGPRLTNEPLWLLFIRPVGMLLVPPILWATLVLGLNVGFTVVISTSVASSLADVYSFDTWQIGLFWLSNLIGAVLGVPAAGALSDHVANRLTQANDGIREPEMRLPTMVIGMVLMPISMLTYGLGLHYRLHWMVPAVGLGIFGFGLVVTGNITIVYSIDAYRPIAGEVVVTQMGFKAAFAFLLGFYVNPWIAAAGYAGTFGTMAGITFVVYAMWIPLYLWGAKLRHASMGWKVMGLVGWHDDREVGE